MRAAAITIGLLVASVAAVRAEQYPAWGDTGWVYASKRDCCNGAIAIAQQYSSSACITSGGVPRPTTGIQRGSCQWEWQQMPQGDMLYRCFAEAAVWCR